MIGGALVYSDEGVREGNPCNSGWVVVVTRPVTWSGLITAAVYALS
jgi:hypothetical protein